jgi:hypothetical protein
MILNALIILFLLWMFTTAAGKAFRIQMFRLFCLTVIYLWCPIIIIYGAFFLR